MAAARAGGKVTFISKIGKDTFGNLAMTYADEGVTTKLACAEDQPTGAAFIFVDKESGDNAIIA